MGTENEKDTGVSRRGLVLGSGAAIAVGTAAVVAAPEATVGWAVPIVKAAVMAPARVASVPPVYPVDLRFVPSAVVITARSELVLTFPSGYTTDGLTLVFESAAAIYRVDTPPGWIARTGPSGPPTYFSSNNPAQITVFLVQIVGIVGAGTHNVIARLESDRDPNLGLAILTVAKHSGA